VKKGKEGVFGQEVWGGNHMADRISWRIPKQHFSEMPKQTLRQIDREIRKLWGDFWAMFTVI